ncbi:MAG: hypothetical protein ACYTGY_01225 [Planctomycetota bacterium]
MVLGNLKYIRASDEAEELYDVIADPGELNNLAGLRAEDRDVLRDLLAAKVATLGTAEGGEGPDFSEALKRRLKSLGYLD